MTTPSLNDPQTDSHAKPGKRGLIWLVLFLVVAGVAGYAVYRAGIPGQIVQTSTAGGAGRAGTKGGGTATPVVVTRARRAAVPVYGGGIGTVTAFYTVTVKPRVDGQLMSVSFNEGDLVHQ